MSVSQVRSGLQVVSCKTEATFKTQPVTSYAAEVLTTAAGVVSDTLINKPGVKPLSFVATSNTGKVATDDGIGGITGDVLAGGTINYITGVVSFTFDDTVLSLTSTCNYDVVAGTADLLHLVGRAERNEVGNEVENTLVKSELTPNDFQIVDFDADLSLPLSVRLNESGNIDFIGANGKLLKGIFGASSYVGATTVAAGVWTTTTFDLTAGGGTGRAVGDLIAVGLSGAAVAGTFEVRQITAISGDTITVAPALSVIPVNTDVVKAVTNYYFNAPESDPASLWFNIYRGKNYLIESGGQRVNSLAFEFPLSGLVGLVATTNGAGGPTAFQEAEVLTPFDGTPQSATNKQPLIASKMVIAKDGTVLSGCRVLTATVNINAENQNDKTIDGGDTVCRSLRGAITVEGSLDVFLQSTADTDAFRAETRGQLIFVAGDVTPTSSRKLLAVSLPRVKYTAAPMSEEGLEEKVALSFRAEDPIWGSARYPRRQVGVAVFA